MLGVCNKYVFSNWISLFLIINISSAYGNDLDFNQWKDSFKKTAIKSNISEETFNKTKLSVLNKLFDSL